MDNLDNKKIIFFSIGLIFILSLGIYFIFFNKSSVKPLDEEEILFPTNSVEEIDLSSEFYQTNIEDDALSEDKNISSIRKISTKAISGAFIYEEDKKEEVFFRYVEKSTGHIYETNSNSSTVERISNTTIPATFKTYWIDQNNLILQYLDNDKIKSYLAYLKNDNDLKSLEGKYLIDNIKDVIIFDKEIFYTSENENSLVGISLDFKGENAKYIFESPLKEWLLEKVDNSKIAFTSKSSEKTLGYLFIYDLKSKSFEKIIGDKYNFSSLVNKNLDVLYLENYRSENKLSLLNNKLKSVYEFPYQTFPEKCVWAKNNIEIYCAIPNEKMNTSDLDNWYKGKKSFTDSIYLINTQNNEVKKIINLESVVGEKIDVIDLKINERESYLIFTNKINYELWSLRLPEVL